MTPSADVSRRTQIDVLRLHLRRAGTSPYKKEASKEGYASTMRTTLTIGEDRCSFKCWDEKKQPMTLGQIKTIHWPSTAFACAATLNGGLLPVKLLWPIT